MIASKIPTEVSEQIKARAHSMAFNVRRNAERLMNGLDTYEGVERGVYLRMMDALNKTILRSSQMAVRILEAAARDLEDSNPSACFSLLTTAKLIADGVHFEGRKLLGTTLFEDAFIASEETKQDARRRKYLPVGQTTEDTRRLRGSLGERVRTPDGLGILLSKTMPHNGLHFDDTRSRWLVWYGTDGAQSGWVAKEYEASEIFTLEVGK